MLLSYQLPRQRYVPRRQVSPVGEGNRLVESTRIKHQGAVVLTRSISPHRERALFAYKARSYRPDQRHSWYLLVAKGLLAPWSSDEAIKRARLMFPSMPMTVKITAQCRLARLHVLPAPRDASHSTSAAPVQSDQSVRLPHCIVALPLVATSENGKLGKEEASIAALFLG